ncbi:TPA: ZPR1 zinc finger domain-containing protein [Candidatus Woesearchaeota archaeon]|nr:ZPR1 zinc finger domain-containing protein [Candidatus Woesearchaeota archaeon]HIH32343.1 ZPR1 zinc finger domain-containing protein [Candidatus Woesearchaeota archaeon]HIH55159.1 ZPR1 zinc finger domain-containing protein [Candidatus Woesearchaeota archaeon]HIJ01412.1 ZPR1 zinc finger domain-containing protein [Candidatus Woesearchaeota archaeon]HIJ13381.1 ZPR1 zinc finger domain-containing protein [Candidatus Woesearchaeota archaeon]
MAKQNPKEEIIAREQCPFCHNKTLTLMDTQKEIPYFGVCFLFAMDCSSCGYHKADIESEKPRDPSRYTIEISNEKDMSIRVIKSSFAAIKMPHIGSIEPGPASNGYVTNIEGVLNRMIKQIEQISNNEEEDEESRKKAKNMIKKLKRVIWGQEKQKLIIEDPTGNSAIISDEAVLEKLKVKNL